jgi:hypothetical protein
LFWQKEAQLIKEKMIKPLLYNIGNVLIGQFSFRHLSNLFNGTLG